MSDYFEDDVFGAVKRAREQWDEPTPFEGVAAKDLLTRVPSVYPGSPDVRSTDPVTSHIARDRAVDSKTVKRLIEQALAMYNRPMVSDEVHRVIVQEIGVRCMPQRVRTVLSNGNGGAWERTEDKLGRSHAGSPAHLWRLKEAA